MLQVREANFRTMVTGFITGATYSIGTQMSLDIPGIRGRTNCHVFDNFAGAVLIASINTASAAWTLLVFLHTSAESVYTVSSPLSLYTCTDDAGVLYGNTEAL